MKRFFNKFNKKKNKNINFKNYNRNRRRRRPNINNNVRNKRLRSRLIYDDDYWITKGLNFKLKDKDIKQDVKINDINEKINSLSKELKEKCVIDDKKTSKKEPREIMTALDMYNKRKFQSYIPTQLKILYYSLYAKYDLQLSTTSQQIMIMPFSYPFIAKDMYLSDYTQPNVFSNLIVLDNGQAIKYPSPLMPYQGDYRIIAISIKIRNMTALINKGGSYTVYRTTDTKFYPVLGKSGLLVADLSTSMVSYYQKNLDNSAEKLLIGPTQDCLIHEYNTIKGLDQFQGPTEYLGQRYPNVSKSDQYMVMDGDAQQPFFQNPIGPSIKYVIRPSFSTTQNITVEVVTIYEINPDPETNLQNSIHAQTSVLSERQRVEIENFKHITAIKA